MINVVCGILLILLVPVPDAAAEAPIKITWEDLVPPAPPLEDPLRHLAVDYQVELELVYSARERKRLGLSGGNGPPVAETLKLEEKLKKEDVDVDGLLARYQTYNDALAQLGEAVVPGLDNRNVRLAGYALPLEFADRGVSEFLLVPYVGACIHAPPPPPNQMVFVRLKQSFQMKELYAPVWVTGRLTIKANTKRLSLVDGSADIDAGYTLQGLRVEPYKE